MLHCTKTAAVIRIKLDVIPGTAAVAAAIAAAIAAAVAAALASRQCAHDTCQRRSRVKSGGAGRQSARRYFCSKQGKSTRSLHAESVYIAVQRTELSRNQAAVKAYAA